MIGSNPATSVHPHWRSIRYGRFPQFDAHVKLFFSGCQTILFLTYRRESEMFEGTERQEEINRVELKSDRMPCGAMRVRTKSRETAGAVFRRLARRGVTSENYGTIKKIVAFDVPQWTLFFSRQFEHRTVADVLGQIERWRVFLSTDDLLLPNQKTELEKWIGGAEFLALQTLMEANFPQVGAWKLEVIPVPTGQGESGAVYRFAGQRVTAFNDETNQTRTALIPGDELNDPARRGGAYRKALESLGVWDLLSKGHAGRGLISARKPQAGQCSRR
jgi:hypothetical protein